MAQGREPVPLKRADFQGEIGGKRIDMLTLTNARGMSVSLTNYGAKLLQILAPDRDGRLADVLLGYDSLAGYVAGYASMNAFIGRYANRIGHGRFALDGQIFQLALNNGPHAIHGGARGSHSQVFDMRQIDAGSAELRYRFADGEEAYPGNVDLVLRYTLTDDNTLDLAYEARSDRKTVVNFTSHGFFNLAGGGSVLDQVLTIHASRYTPVDATSLPTGEIASLAGTPLDFRMPTAVGARIRDAHPQLRIARGYDHNFVIDKADGEFGLAASLYDPRSGRCMEVFSTEPGLQVFSANSFTGTDPRDIGKGGRSYAAHDGLCLEPQHFPDSPNRPGFPSTVLEAGASYKGRITYRFSLR